MTTPNRRVSTPSSPSGPHTTYESFSDLVPVSPTSSSSSPLARARIRAVTSPSPKSSPHANANAGARAAWITPRRSDDVDYDGSEMDEEESEEQEEKRLGFLSTWSLVGLTIGLAGAQLTWTIEMAFGTPYLLSLGLTKQSTSLVWLAGPLSGFIVQPLIGALSDSSSSKYRRRAFIVGSATCVILSTLVVAYARALATVLSSLSGLGDWDPRQEENVRQLAVVIAVSAFYFLDFSLNGLQASLRALILDRAPGPQQNIANSWQGRMGNLGNVFGYWAGYMDLGHWSGISWVGGGQFRKLAVMSCFVMVALVGVTCVTQEEKVVSVERDGEEGDGQGGVSLGKALRNIRESIRTLPVPIRKVCYVQFGAWTGFFPFLFYSTSWVAEVLYASLPADVPPPSSDTATRAGSLALLLFAFVSLLAGSLLPWLSTLGHKSYIKRLSKTSAVGIWTRRALCAMTPRNFWTMGLTMYAACMVGTFWVQSVKGAMVVIACVGVPWAINCWVPFALVMESIRDLEDSPSPSPPSLPLAQHLSPSSSKLVPQPFRTTSTSRPSSLTRAASERTLLLHASSPSTPSHLESSPPSSAASKRPESGGTILGIHNLAIVAPQFFVAIVAAGIFKLIQMSKDATLVRTVVRTWDGEVGEPLQGSNDVVWVLRFGGVAAMVGAVVSRWVRETESERTYKEMVRRDGGADE